MKPRLLDLFCCAGGAAVGYYSAGFEVVGVDIEPQPHYPFGFIQGDALDPPVDLRAFDAVHASPPCQAFTKGQNARKQAHLHPDLIPATRALLRSSGLPYVIENVEGAPLENPVVVCGTALGMEHEGFELRRHRLFESNVAMMSTPCHHRLPAAPVFGHSAGRDWRNRHGRDFGQAARAAIMGVDWMTREELREAIPPAFAEYVGGYLMAAVERAAAA
jgi:DNA (cytosine-5)-methyltransferase 1